MSLSKIIAKTMVDYKKEGLSDNQISEKILNFMKNKGLLGFLPKVIDYLEKENKREKIKNQINIFSSHELNKDTIESIHNKINPESELELKIDESKIGGVRIEYKYKFFDTTLLSMLKKLEKKLKEN